MSSVIFTGGGSIGHIAPSVAVANELKSEHPDVEVRFICSTKEDDASFLKEEGFEYSQIDAPRLSLSFPWKFYKAYKESKKILNELKPRVIFSKGGYVSVPVCLAAKRMKIPIVLHESDAVMGRANRLIAGWAEDVCLGLPPSVESRKSKVESPSTLDIRPSTFTGNPIRRDINQGSIAEAQRITGFIGESKHVLLVMGGSQGSQDLNKFVIDHIDELLKTFNIIHITGHNKKGASNRKGYYSIGFAGDELKDLYAITNVAISRAGANAITELAANNIPTVLVPLEGVAHNHQVANAKAVESDAFKVVMQKNINEELIQVTKKLLVKSRMSNVECRLSNVECRSTIQISQIIAKYLA
ncbi:UDP-N-acetylglucosamine--N-acetylmuramyl-(pentapeptide) pyrophosphoryl-undecaprenol N-acetylglucosamine transferase [Patescibacteria group bacterium]|nr:UDP-N-acetylglucosamine--N-acetylmuramyl-(pentapeptide) pyrophosphoryl-undecaprenol N-acetylglucosamine transferase [Patescibacteria group bacterium]MBU1123570.1 UDP-N-acetylglucosamine--N-acetylmuramyl-(pentapeptide) pyrophosphoryl-undecaprenol N-acetylglucosamine transferase [Patescibacteria group bacterium]